MNLVGLLTSLLPLILRIPDLIKSGSEVVAILRAAPGTPEEIRAQLDDYNRRLDEALEAVKNARLPVSDG